MISARTAGTPDTVRFQVESVASSSLALMWRCLLSVTRCLRVVRNAAPATDMCSNLSIAGRRQMNSASNSAAGAQATVDRPCSCCPLDFLRKGPTVKSPACSGKRLRCRFSGKAKLHPFTRRNAPGPSSSTSFFFSISQNRFATARTKLRFVKKPAGSWPDVPAIHLPAPPGPRYPRWLVGSSSR